MAGLEDGDRRVMAEIVNLSDHRPSVIVERARLDGAAAVVITLRDAGGEILVWDDLSSTLSAEEAIAAWSADGVAVVELRCAGRC